MVTYCLRHFYYHLEITSTFVKPFLLKKRHMSHPSDVHAALCPRRTWMRISVATFGLLKFNRGQHFESARYYCENSLNCCSYCKSVAIFSHRCQNFATFWVHPVFHFPSRNMESRPCLLNYNEECWKETWNAFFFVCFMIFLEEMCRWIKFNMVSSAQNII